MLQAVRIEAGDLDLALEAIRPEVTHRAASATGKQLEDLVTYLTNDRDRMDCPQDRALGLRVGSGAIESVNHHLTGGRLRQQGMRWSERGRRDDQTPR